MPAGIVPTTISHPSFPSGLAAEISRCSSERHMPVRMRTQSFQKNQSRMIAVARWVATRKAMK